MWVDGGALDVDDNSNRIDTLWTATQISDFEEYGLSLADSTAAFKLAKTKKKIKLGPLSTDVGMCAAESFAR